MPMILYVSKFKLKQNYMLQITDNNFLDIFIHLQSKKKNLYILRFFLHVIYTLRNLLFNYI